VAVAPPTSPGHDGRWQGAYACSNFRFGLEMTVTNGEGSFSFFGGRQGGGTAFVKLRIAGDTATFTRTFVEGGGASRNATITGRVSGNQISAGGDESGGSRGCNVTLSRTGGR
jgi:hypothetical protein